VLSFSFSDAPWRYYLRQEPDAAIPHVRIRAGGRPHGRSLPRQSSRPFQRFPIVPSRRAARRGQDRYKPTAQEKRWWKGKKGNAVYCPRKSASRRPRLVLTNYGRVP